ncbi:MAG: hypothetical protein AB7F65_00640 [Dehalococcoidia bacterium]
MTGFTGRLLRPRMLIAVGTLAAIVAAVLAPGSWSTAVAQTAGTTSPTPVLPAFPTPSFIIPTPGPSLFPTPAPGGTTRQPTVTVVNKVETTASTTTVSTAETTGSQGAGRVAVPPGALPANTTVSVGAIEDVASLVAQVPPPATVQVALAFELTATTTEGVDVSGNFAQPVELSFTVAADAIPAGTPSGNLTVAFWNGRGWVQVDTTVTLNDDGTYTLRAMTDHFSTWAVLVVTAEAPAAPAAPSPADTGAGLEDEASGFPTPVAGAILAGILLLGTGAAVRRWGRPA